MGLVLLKIGVGECRCRGRYDKEDNFRKIALVEDWFS